MRSTWFDLIALLPILLLAGFLRLTGVAENPHWYTDEATHLDIASHLADGAIRYMAIQDSTLLFARPPLFHLILAPLLRLNPGIEAMLILRQFTAILGVLTVVAVYVVIRQTGDRLFALIAALILAILPQVILYNRIGFSYNLVAPLVIVALGGMAAWARSKHPLGLAIAAIAIGLGTISDLTMFNLIPPLILVVITLGQFRTLLWSIPLSLLPFALYAVVMLLHAPESFLFDARFTFSRLGSGVDLVGQLENVIHNYRVLITGDLWFPIGLIGLWVTRPAYFRWIVVLLLLIPVVNIGRIAALYNLSAYYLIPFWPLIAIGVAALIRFGLAQIVQTVNDLPVARFKWAILFPAFAFTIALIGVPIVDSLTKTIGFVQTRYVTDIDPFLTNAYAAREVAIYLNEHTQPNDLVIATPIFGWMLHAQTADYQMTAASMTQGATPHLPALIPADRWVFDPSYTRARYVVIDPTWYNWGQVHVPGVREMLSVIETWPIVLSVGELRVHQNPSPVD
ncbi:MAG: glycosyltransferase family 39 protein [Anaerolineae bacterium]|nr:glycosyltransferase family 39 protein [Anaerolineae bacterium]